MASSASNKASIGRSAAILTTSEVAGSALDLNNAYQSQVCVDLSFTIGSLTNVIVRFYASMDGTTYDPVYNGATAVTETLTASGERCYVIPPLAGWKYFRVSVQGTGTTTSSTANFTYRYLRRGSQ
ncbi:hypothetical protein WMF38_57505 [Sorangium sp. So ce118]